MGTSWSLRFDNPSMLAPDHVRAAVQAVLDRVIEQMSTWEPGSDISRFNAAEAGSLHLLPAGFAAVLSAALDWARASGGAIDPTVGALVGLWGFGSDAAQRDADASDSPPLPPSAAQLRQARLQVGWQRLEFDRTTRKLLQPGGLRLDLSGIAKGYAVDQVAEALRAIGIVRCLIEIGGELRALGHRPDGQDGPDGMPWQVAVETAPQVQQRIALAGMAIATSGDRFHAHAHADRHQGRRWSHTIDPRSGEPSSHALASVTVLHPECMHADALATVLMVLGPQEGLEFAERHRLAALFHCRDGAGDDGDQGLRCFASEAWPGAAQAGSRPRAACPPQAAGAP